MSGSRFRDHNWAVSARPSKRETMTWKYDNISSENVERKMVAYSDGKKYDCEYGEQERKLKPTECSQGEQETYFQRNGDTEQGTHYNGIVVLLCSFIAAGW